VQFALSAALVLRSNARAERECEQPPRRSPLGERPAEAQSRPLMRRPAKKANQGLAEYVLLLALVIFAATVGIESLASAVNSAFSKVGELLGRYLS